MSVHPTLLPANQPADRFYQGGQQIAQLRGEAWHGGNLPEDWVASTTCLWGESQLGLTRLPNGELLRDAVEAEPLQWLGPDHVARWGTDTMLLTKILDAGQRLPVHIHPDDQFARIHLGRAHGKTEAWLVLTPGVVHLGFKREVSLQELAELVERQDTRTMLEALHEIEVRPGDAILVPAGFPHAIGEGLLLVEVQQPEDLSILLEWKGFALDADAPKALGLDWDLALQATALRVSSPEDIAALITSGGTGVALPATAAPFFRASWVGEGELEQSFAVLVVTDGDGALRWEGGELPLSAGSIVVIPHSSATRIEGDVSAVWCRPPAIDVVA